MLKIKYDKKYYNILNTVDGFKMKINLKMDKMKSYEDDLTND